MPKNLKTLDRTKGRAPLLVPHPEQEDENFRQLSLRFLQSRQWRAFRLRVLADRTICDMNPVASTLANISTTSCSASHQPGHLVR